MLVPFLCVSLILSFTAVGHGYQILFLAPVVSWSEFNLAGKFSEILTDAGHTVTLISTFSSNKRQQSIREINILTSELSKKSIFDVQDLYHLFAHIKHRQETIAEMMYSNQDVMEVWLNRNDYDAIISLNNLNEIISPFLLDYGGAYIGYCMPGIDPLQSAHQGNRIPKSVSPVIFLPYDDTMSFLERTINFVSDRAFYYYYKYSIINSLYRILDKYFPGMPPPEPLYHNYSLLLINGHFAMDGLLPLLPNQVEVGLMAAKNPDPLPEALESFVSAAEEGLIFFSLGSLAKSTDMSTAHKEMFVEAFKQVPQRVLWKYAGDDLTLPPNVATYKWLPQQDILGHPKTVLFISHCGTFGLQEAKYNGVPVLGVPISMDQPRNAQKMARKGFGTVLNWEDITVDRIVQSINNIIKNPDYKIRLREVSLALKDQKESPAERGVWWVEYAIRHKDHGFMHYAGKKLNSFQYHLLDVFLFLIFIAILFIIFNCWIMKIMLKLVRT